MTWKAGCGGKSTSLSDRGKAARRRAGRGRATTCNTAAACRPSSPSRCPFFALVLLGWLAARRRLAAGERDPGPQRLRAVLRPAVHAVPLRLEPAVRRGSPIRCCSASTLVRRSLIIALHDRGDAAARRPAERRRPARRRLRRARRRVPERRLHGRAAAGRAARRRRRRPGDRRDRWSTSSSPARSASPSRSRTATARAPPTNDRCWPPRRSRCAARSPIRCRGRSRSAPCSPRPAASCPRRSAQIVRMLGDSATPVALFTIGTRALARRPARPHAHAGRRTTCRWR